MRTGRRLSTSSVEGNGVMREMRVAGPVKPGGKSEDVWWTGVEWKLNRESGDGTFAYKDTHTHSHTTVSS